MFLENFSFLLTYETEAGGGGLATAPDILFRSCLRLPVKLRRHSLGYSSFDSGSVRLTSAARALPESRNYASKLKDGSGQGAGRRPIITIQLD